VLCFIDLGTWRVHLAGVTVHPDGAWVAQQARNLRLVLGERGRQLRFVVRDRDAKFTRAFDHVFGSDDADVLITGRGHLEQVLRIYIEHDNGHRPHRALGLEPPDAPTGPIVISDNPRRVHRRDRLSGLLHEYHRQAA
jgi:hypothetical protein